MAFDHMSEVPDGLIHCQELAFVRAVRLLSGAELAGLEVKWRLYTGGLWYELPVKIKHAKEMSEVFDQDRLLETVYCRNSPPEAKYLQLKLCS